MHEAKVILGKRVLDFIDSMRDVTGHDTVCKRIAEKTNSLGFCYVSVFDIPKPGMSVTKSVSYNSRPPEYVELYDKNNYVVIDPLISAIRASRAPVAWSDLRLGGLRKEQLKILYEASEFGVANGIVVPIISADGAVSVFSASGRDPDVTGSARSAIEIIAMHSHQLLHRAQAKHESPAKPPLLTRREREIMTWVAAGKTDGEIAGILNIRRETVITHVSNSKIKLNASRRTLAVVQALRLGEIAI